MKNKKIIDSWNSIAPDESSEKRMLKAILDKNHNAEYEGCPDEDSDIITNEYTVSRGKTAKQILRTALPAAACIALIFGVVKFTSDYLPAGDNNDNEINISTGETSGTVISEMTESEKSTDSSFSSVSEMTAVTDIPANSDTDASAASSAVSSDENQKSSETAGPTLTESQKVEKKETERTVPANTEPETADKEENPKTQKVTDPKYITTTVTKESKPRQTLPEVTTEIEVTTVTETNTDEYETFDLTPSKNNVAELLSSYDFPEGAYGNDELYNITPQEITDKYGFRIFKYDQCCESYLEFNGGIYHIGTGFVGAGTTSFAVADLNSDGNPELYYTFSWGSGMHRSQIGYFDTAVLTDFAVNYDLPDHEIKLSSTNAALEVCEASVVESNGFAN
ncbi:MAG: hypothetical protein J6P89_01310, partial [Oscillospiraceae bacterium]|nr:hypothetical protein [Oscillospiraceae bacterium]